MRVLVCGGRNYGHVIRTTGLIKDEPVETQKRLAEYRRIMDVLNGFVELHSKEYNPDDNWLPTDITIIAGGATGADKAAADFATVHFCQYEEYPADWNKYGKRAGYIRNQQMLDEGKPDVVIAFPGGRGTAMMVDLSRKAGVRVIEIN